MKKIYPYGVGNSPDNSFTLLLISEGFKEEDERAFHDACTECIDRIFQDSPFNHTKQFPYWITIFSHYIPSNNTGASLNTSVVTDRTVFESSLDTNTNHLTFNQEKITNTLEKISNMGSDMPNDASIHLEKGILDIRSRSTLPVIILPRVESPNKGGEAEYIPQDESSYYYVAVTQNEEWHQVIIRAICKFLGLGDEYDSQSQSGSFPSDEEGLGINLSYPNIVYFHSPPTGSPHRSFKWYTLLTSFSQSKQLEINPNNFSYINNEPILPVNSYTPDKIELWVLNCTLI